MSDELFEIIDDTKESSIPVFGRSEIEHWINCPAQGWFVSSGSVSTGSMLADAGSECHRIIADAVKARSLQMARPNELREQILAEAAKSRPDVQPIVVDALKNPHALIQLLCFHQDNGEARNADDLLRYDGGEGQHKGQLAEYIDVDGVRVKLTCEVDLLMSTRSAAVVDLYDHKSGMKKWTHTHVYAAFQFRFYGLLTLMAYPLVDTVNISVYMPRMGQTTAPVQYRRKDMYATEQQIKGGIRAYFEHRDKTSVTGIPVHPDPSRCAICPGVLLCEKPHHPLPRDAQSAMEQIVALDARRTALMKFLRLRWADASGDLVYRDANLAFGDGYPKKVERGRPLKVYKPSATTEAPDEIDTNFSPGMREMGEALGDEQ